MCRVHSVGANVPCWPAGWPLRGLSLLFAALLSGALGTRADDVLLQADFDRGSAIAAGAKGDPNPIAGTQGQPRPAPGIGGQSAEV